MTRTLLPGLLLISFPLWMLAAGDNFPYGGRQAGMGNSAVALYDFWAVSHNQAGLAQLQQMAAGFYFENRYMAREMSLGAAAIAFPTPSGVFSASISYFGFSQYYESKAGLSYSRSFSEKLSAGMQLNYIHTSIAEGYGSRGNFAAELGMIYQLLPNMNIGAHIFNPTRARRADYYDERIPTILRMGLSYLISDKALLSVETEKDIDRNPVLRAGLEYQVITNIFVRAGVGTQPTTNAFGFGFKTGSLNIDIASSFHHILGYSPQISILYHFH